MAVPGGDEEIAAPSLADGTSGSDAAPDADIIVLPLSLSLSLAAFIPPTKRRLLGLTPMFMLRFSFAPLSEESTDEDSTLADAILILILTVAKQVSKMARVEQ